MTARLTPSERTVLILLANGHRPRDIAAQQHITIGTLRSHLQRINRKLATHSAVQATATALVLGEIHPSDILIDTPGSTP